MTPIQKAKEIVKKVLEDWSIAGRMNAIEESDFSKAFDDWAKTPSAAALLSGEDWISVESGNVPQAVDNKMKPVLVRHLKYKDKVFHTVAFYFPDRFKTVEWEDWDDYDEKDYPYTENDADKGCVWLRAGWYEEIDCEKCDGYWSRPLKVTHYMPLPEPPKP